MLSWSPFQQSVVRLPQGDCRSLLTPWNFLSNRIGKSITVNKIRFEIALNKKDLECGKEAEVQRYFSPVKKKHAIWEAGAEFSAWPHATACCQGQHHQGGYQQDVAFTPSQLWARKSVLRRLHYSFRQLRPLSTTPNFAATWRFPCSSTVPQVFFFREKLTQRFQVGQNSCSIQLPAPHEVAQPKKSGPCCRGVLLGLLGMFLIQRVTFGPSWGHKQVSDGLVTPFYKVILEKKGPQQSSCDLIMRCGSMPSVCFSFKGGKSWPSILLLGHCVAARQIANPCKDQRADAL